MAQKKTKAKDDKDITVEALLSVNGQEIRKFDAAWRLGMAKATSGELPVDIKFIQWVRKEDK